MGSGKSTLAKELHKQTKKMILDSDLIIANQENKSIPEIFKTQGEEYFRNLEGEFCQFVKQNIHSCIISTGGGMPIFNNVKQMGKVFFLSIDFETLYNRLDSLEISKRPLFKDKDSALHLYQKRLANYQKSADIILEANKTPQELAQRVLENL